LNAKIVLARTVYEENVGLVARAMANFGFSELALVKPECNWLSGKAKSRAMHGQGVLLNAKKFGSIGEAVKDCSFAIAFSAKKGAKRNSISIEEIGRRIAESRAKIALVFGSEPSGLENGEIAECDFVAAIPAAEKYPALNLSHAVAIALYSFFKTAKAKKSFPAAKPATKRLLLNAFESELELLSSIDDKKAVLAAFRALVSRSLVSEKEAKAMVAFLKGIGKGKKGFYLEKA